jgi:AcrR family transcriptional regulator
MTGTRDALLEHGALLFARHGVGGVTARQLHAAVGARNESALHYHFGDRDGLVSEIVRAHLETIERRRAPLVAAIAAEDRAGDLRALVHALAAPMAEELATPRGRAHLRLVAQLSHPALAYERAFRAIDAPAGRAVARWLRDALQPLPEVIRIERLAALRAQLISLFALRAQLLDDAETASDGQVFVANLIDLLVAGLAVEPSSETSAAAGSPRARRR